MWPTYRDGDRLLIRYGARPRVGRCAVVRLPVPGAPSAPVIAVKRVVARYEAGWWVERDNPREGVDSWQVGEIDEGDLLAVVWCRVWPLRVGRSKEVV